MAKIAYVRSSSILDPLDSQLAKLRDCEKIFQETSTGLGNQPVLEECLAILRAGDSFVVLSKDRLTRSVAYFEQLTQQLERRKVQLHMLE